MLPDHWLQTQGSGLDPCAALSIRLELAAGAGTECTFLLGYAGWGGGQLEGEMRENAWLNVMADSSIVFDTPVVQRFDGALDRLGIKLDRLYTDVGHA